MYLLTQRSGRVAAVRPSDQPPVMYAGACEMLPVEQLHAASRFDAHGFPRSIPDAFELRAMLTDREFARLNTALETLQRYAEADFHREGWINTAFAGLSREEEGYEPLFDAWVEAFPGSAVARIARARYRADLGWLARGHAWASKTSQDQFDEMRRQFEGAYEDVQQGLQWNPRVLYGYSLMVELANAGGNAFGNPREHYEAGLKISPHSMRIRQTYMNSLEPRWGGSYAEMHRLADASQVVASENPFVRTLYGWIPWDQATLSRDQEERIRLCTTALSYGEESRFLRTRADAALQLKRYTEAFADYDRAVKLSPLDVDARAGRAELHAYLGSVALALEDLDIAERLEPTNWRVKRARAYISKFEAHAGQSD